MQLPNDQLKSLLLQAGVIDQKMLTELEVFAKNAQTSLQEAIIEKDIITDEKLGLLIADYLKFPFISLAKMTIPEDVFEIVPERIARKFKVIAFARDADGVRIAMANPTNTQMQELISRKVWQRVTAYMATERDIDNTLQMYKKDLKQTFDELLQTELTAATNASSDLPIAKIVDLLIVNAYRDKASDIHIEPEEKDSLIRFRIDGILHDVLKVDKKFHDRIITRIKVLSRLRTDEHLSAQDGKMRMEIDDEKLDLRVSIIPVTEGEKGVLRLLSSKFRQFSLQDLGMNEKDLKKVNSAINKA
jgi:type IV pilus assembly protein PilB